MYKECERDRDIWLRREEIDHLPERGAIFEAELGTPLLHGFGAIILGLSRPPGEDLGMIGHACAIVVLGFEIDGHFPPPRDTLIRAECDDVEAPAHRRYVRTMRANGKHTRTIWLEPDGWSVGIIDQTQL